MTMMLMNPQDDIPTTPTESCINQFVLLFDLSSRLNACENCRYQQLTGEPLSLRQNFTFSPEQVTELIVLREQKNSIPVAKTGLVGRNT